MKRIIAGLVLWVVWYSGAFAQTTTVRAQAQAVASCGGLSLSAGVFYPITQDLTGTLCISGGGGGGGLSVAYGGAIGANGTPGGYKDGTGNFQPFLGDTTNGQWVYSGQKGDWYIGTYTLGTFVQPTVTASSAYASGNVVGGLMTFTNAGRTAGATGMLTSVVLDFQDAQTGSWDLLLFDQNPTNSTFTDKAAVSVNVNDINKLIKVVHIADCTSTGTTSSCQADGVAKNYSTTATSSLFGVLVTRGTPTFGVTNDIMVRLFGQKN